jgi:hypothetical protein
VSHSYAGSLVGSGRNGVRLHHAERSVATDLSRAGVALMSPPAGSTARASMVLATLQVDLGDVFLKSAVPLPGKSAISLRLSASAPINAAVAWFALD